MPKLSALVVLFCALILSGLAQAAADETATPVPGIAMHPSGALVYQPFLNGPASPESATPTPNPNLRGGLDIFDTHSGQLRIRIFLPEPIAARSADTSGLLAQFLTVDETGQRIFAITNSGLTVIQRRQTEMAIPGNEEENRTR